MDMFRSHMHFSATDIQHLAITYRRGGFTAVKSEIEEKVKEFNNVKLDIAVMGEAGVGKSSLINALRGLGVNDKRAAPTGCTETTMKPTPYPHPSLPNVTYWDLPGIGTVKQKAKKYLKQLDFSLYDTCIIVSDNCFSENDAILSEKAKKAGKPFYFVRSKIDQAILTESKKASYNQEQMFQDVREYCTSSLNKVGIKNPHVFLLSSNGFEKYDFPELKKVLNRELPEMKKNLFLLTLPNTSIDVIESKQRALKVFIHILATISGCVGAVPIPGLSLVCDLALMGSGLLSMRAVLGLDSASIQKVAKRVGKPEADLQANIQYPWVLGDIDEDLVMTMLKRSSIAMALTGVELALDFVPIVGSVFGAASSFGVTYFMLSEALDQFVQSAKTVLHNAQKLASTTALKPKYQ
ncbi:interferon-inducible GTPase 5-like [Heptranchias perlo]|uniref:interferon-inducible GTPase 5-like n=1 Tax=Heptranchias perlo TaxID=212740 RepID=UPI00355A823A